MGETELEITRLRLERQQLAKERKAASRNLRNAERKRKRLCDKASALSTTDLLTIVAVRSAREVKKAKKTEEQGLAGEPDAADTDAGDSPPNDGDEGQG